MSWRAAASAATTTWCARTGRSGWAPRPSRCSAACPRTSTAACSASPRRPARTSVNGDRMWHYVEGIENYAPVWAQHGIRILPGPSSMWFDATGKRLPVPLFPGFDTLGTLEYLRQHRLRPLAGSCSTQSIIEKEFALSRQRAEPRPHRQEHAASCCGSDSARARPDAGRGVQGARAPTSWSPTRSTSCSPGCGKLSPDVELDTAQHPPRDRGARPRARQHLQQGRPGHRASAAPATTAATSSSGWRSRTRSSTRSTARSSR